MYCRAFEASTYIQFASRPISIPIYIPEARIKTVPISSFKIRGALFAVLILLNLALRLKFIVKWSDLQSLFESDTLNLIH